MKHLVIFFYIISLTSGMGMIMLITVFYYRLRISYLKSYIIFLWMFFLYIGFNLYRTYIVNIPSVISPWFHTLSLPFHFLFIPGFCIMSIKFLHDFTKKPFHFLEKVYISILIVYYTGLTIIPFILYRDPRLIYSCSYEFLSGYQHFIFFCCFFFINVFIMIRQYKMVSQLYIKKALKWFFIATGLSFIVTFPVYFLIIKNPAIPVSMTQLFDVSLVFTFYYLMFNITNFIYFIRHVFEHSIKNDDSSLLVFAKTYSISQSELNVLIHALKEENTYKEIADKLFVSVRTVETHLYKVYKKTNTKSRKELIELYQSVRNV